MKELHFTKKDFSIDWFSGQGAGGQHRNKHMNCVRITHLKTGLSCTGQNSRSRVENQKDAFTKLAYRLIAYYNSDINEDENRGNNGFGSAEVIRNYHAVRNEVHDKASGLKKTYKEVVQNVDISPMIEARLEAMSGDKV